MTLMLAEIPPIAINFMVVGFFLVCLIMILTVLIQKPQGGGLSGAFGSGAGSGQTAFGARTGDALTVATIAIFLFYILAAIGLNYVVRPSIAAPAGTQASSTEQANPPATGETTGTAPAPAPAGDATPSPTPTTPPAETPATNETPAPSGEPGTEEPATTDPASTEPASTEPTSPSTPG